MAKKKDKFWEKTGVIPFDAWNNIINVVYTNDIEKARSKRSKELKGTDMNFKNVDGLCSYHDDIIYIFLSPKSTIGTVSHECYHAICRIFEWAGVENFDEEMVAYHLGYTVDMIWDLFNENKK